ncbi:kinase RLK-Pelle-CrRLK1L-1 family protein, partial [Tanacetum coccineum]
WYLDDGTIIGDTKEVAKAIDIIRAEGPRLGLELNIKKTEVFWPSCNGVKVKEGLFPRDIGRPTLGVKLLGGAVSRDAGFISSLAVKRASRAVELMSLLPSLRDPQSELLLLRSCMGVAKLLFGLRTCQPMYIGEAVSIFDNGLRRAIEAIMVCGGSFFWGFPMEASITSNSDHILQGCGIDGADSDYGYALDRVRIEIVKSLGVSFDLSPRQKAVVECLRAPRAQNFLTVIPIEGLGQHMSALEYRTILKYRLMIPLFPVDEPCPVCRKGEFGRVYKGQLRISSSKTTNVAVKLLDVKGGQGQHEFLMEIVMLSSYKHDNLVSLVGFSEEGDEKIIVYEHEARGSLQICLGAARALNYLHGGVGEGHRVLHRDIKSSNILLDENWEAKVSDFGLSKIGPTNQEFTSLVTNAAGTFGYVDPLYVTTGVLTKESDVYSFGVVLFEVLCGRLGMIGNYNDERRFLSHLARLRYEEGKLDEIILPSIKKQIKTNSLQIFSRIAYQCLEIDRKRHPTMALIMEQLQISLELQIGCRRMTRIGLWGSSTGGSPWSLQLGSNQKLRKITIDHEDWIYSIGFTKEEFGGLLDSSQHHGGGGGKSGGEISEINVDANEEITGILGTVGVTTGRYAGYTVISSLCFMTNKTRHGPFGKETGTPFSVPWELGSFAGFYGRAGFYLDGLGCYLKATI